jgi:hypothetical protein
MSNLLLSWPNYADVGVTYRTLEVDYIRCWQART